MNNQKKNITKFANKSQNIRDKILLLNPSSEKNYF